MDETDRELLRLASSPASAEIVDFYNLRDVATPEVAENVDDRLGDLRLQDDEEEPLIKFLKTLDDAEGPPWRR